MGEQGGVGGWLWSGSFGLPRLVKGASPSPPSRGALRVPLQPPAKAGPLRFVSGGAAVSAGL